jgi:hypothetical protein
VQFALNDKETVKTAIRRAGLQGDIESQIYNAIFADGCEYQSRYRRPLVALLLTCLPSISKVYAHIPTSVPFLGAVLRTAMASNRPTLVYSRPDYPAWRNSCSQ